MKRILIILLTINCSLFTIHCSARLKGQAKIDSLLKELPRAKEDTNKVKLLNMLAAAYRPTNFDLAVKYAIQSVALADKVGIEQHRAKANYKLGNIYLDHSENGDALKCYNIALEIEQKTGDKTAIASLLNNIAIVYNNLSDYPKALETNLKALKLFEEIGDKSGTANCHINIGTIVIETADHAGAVQHFQKALAIYKEVGPVRCVAVALNNLGDAYGRQNDNQNALKYFQEALALYTKDSAYEGMSMALANIAGVYVALSDYKQGLDFGSRALKIAKDIQLPEDMGYDYKIISAVYYGIATNDTAKNKTGIGISKAAALKMAGKYIDSAMAVYGEIGALKEMAGTAEMAGNINYAAGNYRDAYKSHELFKKLNDSVFNIEKNKKLTQTAMQYDFDKKEAAARAEQERKDTVHRNVRNSILAGLAGALIFGVVVMRQRNKVKKEKARSEELLLNILPEEVAIQLKDTGKSAARHYDNVTVLFTDFVNFTQAAEKMSAQGLIDELHECFKTFDEITSKYNIEKIKTIGDAYLAVCGLPSPDPKHAENVVSAAIEINTFMQDRLSKMGSDRTFSIRIGIHSGSVVAGIVGVKKFAYDIWGDTVNTAARMEQNSEAGKINISQTTYELVKDGFNCEYRGEVEVKGKGIMKMYFVS